MCRGVQAAGTAPRVSDLVYTHPALVTVSQTYAEGPPVEQPTPHSPVDDSVSHQTACPTHPAWLHAQGTRSASKSTGRRHFDGGSPDAMEPKATLVAPPILLSHNLGTDHLTEWSHAPCTSTDSPHFPTDSEVFHVHSGVKHIPPARSHCPGEAITPHCQHIPPLRDLHQATHPRMVKGCHSWLDLMTTWAYTPLPCAVSGPTLSLVNRPAPRQCTVALWPLRGEVDNPWPPHTNE